MDELSDDNLKKAFSKLQRFESKQEGTSWSSIEKAIAEGESPTRIGYALSLVVLLLFMFPSSVNDFRGEEGGTTSSSVEVTKPVAENHSVAKEHRIEKTEKEGNRKSEKIQSVVLQTPASSTLTHKETIRNENALLTKIPAEFSATMSITLPIQYEILSTKYTADNSAGSEKEESKARQFTLGLAGVYQFGVVDPIPTDNNVLSSYSSKPGFGLKGDLVLPASIGRKKLDLSFTYAFIYKKMNFSFEEYAPETVRDWSKRRQTFSHILGAGVSYPIRAQWNIGAHVNYQLGNAGMRLHTGKMFLSASLQKNFSVSKSDLYLGATGGLPLTGKIEYFRYYPLQVYFGYKIKR